MDKLVSIIIPSKNEQFLQNTIKDLLSKAKGDIEIIAVLDGYWPNPPLENEDRLKVLHIPNSGMRAAINAGVAVAKGKYIMKLDGHCMVDDGFDVKLREAHQPDWVQVPRRKRLDAENWDIQDVGKPDVDYEFLSYPYWKPDEIGMHGTIWTQRALDRKDIMIDENPSFQGSCYFIEKDYFYKLELLDDENYGIFGNEAQEVGLKCWLSGGKVMTNKNTWYAHLHKGKKYGRGYFINKGEFWKSRDYTLKWLDNEAWDKQTLPFSYMLEKFPDMPTWPKDWQKKKKIDNENILDKIVQRYQLDLSKHKEYEPIEIKNVTREELPRMLNDFNLKVGVEVGTERGKYAKTLCELNPGVKLTCVDPWLHYSGYREHVSQGKLDNFYEETKEILKDYNVSLVRKLSVEAANDFENESLDFVYIDGNHDFKHVVEDLCAWYPKVKKGGIISGHDYIRIKRPMQMDVVEALHGFTRSYRIQKLFLLGRKQAQRNSDPQKGELRDRNRSWFFIKE